MRVEGERSFAAPRETVWEVLNDPAQMAELMPGVESFDVEDDRHWTANVKIPLGLGGLRMSMRFDKIEERPPEYAKLDAKGTGVGAMLSMQTAFNLADVDGGTAMTWEAEVSIAGPVGAMGQRVLQPIINQQVSAVLNALDQQVMAALGSDESKETPTPAFEPGPAPDLAASSIEGAADDPAFDPAPPVPADPTPDAEPAEGTSGADEGISPWSEEAYSTDPQGPTTSTEDQP
jgi:carbon monoxide dehydrogenase subunit G